jgi:hypothetical protein
MKRCAEKVPEGNLRAACAILLVCALSMSSIASTGCSTMRPIARPVAPGNIDSGAVGMWGVSPGDVVRITLRDGRRITVKVQTVDATGVVAVDRLRYEAADILTLERKSFSGPKTAILVAAGIAAFVLVAYAAAVASLAGNFAGPQ